MKNTDNRRINSAAMDEIVAHADNAFRNLPLWDQICDSSEWCRLQWAIETRRYFMSAPTTGDRRANPDDDIELALAENAMALHLELPIPKPFGLEEAGAWVALHNTLLTLKTILGDRRNGSRS